MFEFLSFEWIVHDSAGGFQGCYPDNHRNNGRCARAVPALCPRCARAVRTRPLRTAPRGQPFGPAATHQPLVDNGRTVVGEAPPPAEGASVFSPPMPTVRWMCCGAAQCPGRPRRCARALVGSDVKATGFVCSVRVEDRPGADDTPRVERKGTLLPRARHPATHARSGGQGGPTPQDGAFFSGRVFFC